MCSAPPIRRATRQARRPFKRLWCERLIGSVRRECTDHLIVLNPEHLRRILAKYASYYNEARTHVSLGRDEPCTRPIDRFGDVVAHPILGGYIIGTLEFRSRKRQPYFETSSAALSMLSGLPRWVSMLRLDNEYCDREPRP